MITNLSILKLKVWKFNQVVQMFIFGDFNEFCTFLIVISIFNIPHYIFSILFQVCKYVLKSVKKWVFFNNDMPYLIVLNENYFNNIC